MLKIVICDDEKVYCNDLKKIIGTELELCGISFEIKEFLSGEELLGESNLEQFQIIFLDIELKKKNGIDTAKDLRKRHYAGIIIFVTSHADFVFTGYEVRALNYILKPYKKEKILEVLHCAIEEQNLIKKQFYLVENRGKSIPIQLTNIQYFFSQKRSINLVTLDNVYVFYSKLSDVLVQLPENFVRIHNRYLINLKHLQEIEGNQVLINNEKLPISRSYKQQLLIAYAKYVLY